MSRGSRMISELVRPHKSRRVAKEDRGHVSIEVKLEWCALRFVGNRTVTEIRHLYGQWSRQAIEAVFAEFGPELGFAKGSQSKPTLKASRKNLKPEGPLRVDSENAATHGQASETPDLVFHLIQVCERLGIPETKFAHLRRAQPSRTLSAGQARFALPDLNLEKDTTGRMWKEQARHTIATYLNERRKKLVSHAASFRSSSSWKPQRTPKMRHPGPSNTHAPLARRLEWFALYFFEDWQVTRIHRDPDRNPGRHSRQAVSQAIGRIESALNLGRAT